MPDREPDLSARPANHRIDPSDVQNPLLRKAMDLWTNLKGARPFPARTEITPRNMADFLRNTVLVRVIDGGTEFEFRIVGDAIVHVQGESFRGMTTAEIDVRIPSYGAMLKHIYSRVVEKRQPFAYRGWFVQPSSHRAFFHESILLPLGPSADAVDHLLIVGIYAFDAEGLMA